MKFFSIFGGALTVLLIACNSNQPLSLEEQIVGSWRDTATHSIIALVPDSLQWNHLAKDTFAMKNATYIFNADGTYHHTVENGLPEGFLENGTWLIDEVNKTLTFNPLNAKLGPFVLDSTTLPTETILIDSIDATTLKVAIPTENTNGLDIYRTYKRF